MKSEMLESEAIEVVAERPLVQMDLTSTMAKVSGDQIAALPIEDLAGVVNLQAGVVDGHFRGGRTSEVKYLIDGVSVTDAFTGEYTMEADVNSIEEVQVLTGTFNAEYGEAMSGIVNQVTKIPRAEIQGNLSGYAGDYFTNRTDIYKNTDDISPRDIYNFQANLGGAIPYTNENLKFYLAGRYFNDEGYLYGQRIFNPWDYSDFSANDPADWYVGATGDSQFVSMNYSKRVNLQGKLYFHIGDSKWIILQAFYQNREYSDYDHNYQLNPDGNYRNSQDGLMASLTYTHVFSPATYMDFKLLLF